MNNVWTDKRVEEFKKLHNLLYTILSLDNGSCFISKIQQCISDADYLTKNSFKAKDFGFLWFLEDLIIKSRTNNKEE